MYVLRIRMLECYINSAVYILFQHSQLIYFQKYPL